MIAFASAIVWRLEIESHGWGGLGWVWYFHRAVPLGVVMFVMWASIVGQFRSTLRRVLFALCMLVLALPMYVATELALLGYFGGGPNPSLLFSPFAMLVFLVYPAIPILVWIMARAFQLRIPWVRALVSIGVFLGAYPVSWLAVRLLNRGLGDYSIHAIKTGYIIPLLVIGLGILFLGDREARGPTSA